MLTNAVRLVAFATATHLNVDVILWILQVKGESWVIETGGIKNASSRPLLLSC